MLFLALSHTFFSKERQKIFKIHSVYFGAVRSPEQIINHALPERKANSQRNRKFTCVHSFAIVFYGKCVDLKLFFEQSRHNTLHKDSHFPVKKNNCHCKISKPYFYLVYHIIINTSTAYNPNPPFA